jgi:protease I
MIKKLILLTIIIYMGGITEIEARNSKKILMVIAEQRFRDEELIVPQKEFVRAGFKVAVASTSAGEAIGKLGAKVRPDTELSKVNFFNYDAIVVVGGPGSSEYLWNNKILHKGLADMLVQGKIVSAICASPVVLAKAGIIKGKKVTVFPGTEEIKELKKTGAIYINQNVVVDGKIVTGNGPDAALEFTKAILKLLKTS